MIHIQGRHLEHFTGSLAIRSGDNGRMDIDKPTLLKEFMDRIGRGAAYPKSRGKKIGSGAQMLDRTQEFRAVALWLQRIIRR